MILKKRVWYAEKCIENGWNKVVLDHQIDLNLYQRQSDNSAKLTNFGEHLPAVQGELAQDLIKDPYIFELSGLTERSAERDIEKAMVDPRTLGPRSHTLEAQSQTCRHSDNQ